MKKTLFLAPVVAAGLALAVAAIVPSTAAAPGALSSVATPGDDTSLGALRYRGHFGGIRVADVVLSLKDSGDAYAGHMNIAASGLLGMAVNFTGEAHASGAVADNGRLRPKGFERIFTTDGETGRVEIRFDPRTGAAQGIEDGNPVQGLSAAQLRGVVDPLAALVRIRQQVLAGRTGSTYIEVFDGKRRLNVDAKIGKLKSTTLERRRNVQVIPVEADLEPVSGFSKAQERGWRDSKLHVLFSADGRAVPVQIMVHTPLGVAAMNLICGAETPCPY